MYEPDSSSDDEGPEPVPPISRRDTLSSTTTKYYVSDDGHTVVEVEPSDFGGEVEDDYYTRTPLVSAAPMRPAATASVRAASMAMTSARGGSGGSISRSMSTNSRTSQQSGFRHQSDTHTTYNITNRENGRQLFVSAPIGSREAAIHDQVVVKAAASGSKVRASLQ